MRVTHVVPSFYPAMIYGGPIVSTEALCRYTTRLGCEVRVLTTNANGRDAVLDVDTQREITSMDSVRIRYCSRIIPHDISPSMLSVLPHYIRWADVVHLTAVYSMSTLPALACARLLGKPVIWSPRGSLQAWMGKTRACPKGVWNTACRYLASENTCMHVTSEDEALSCRNAFPKLSTALVPNGVEVPPTPAKRTRSSVLRVLFVGRLHRIKALENLLDACAKLGIDGPAPFDSWSLVLAGQGDPTYVSELRDRINVLGLGGRVRMVGAVEGEMKDRAFADAEVLVLPSYKENFGMAVAEALARGIPVLASRMTPWEGVEQTGCGLWVDNDPASLASALRQVARMPMEEMGLRGRAWMHQSFSWDRRAQEMLDVYRSAVDRATTAGAERMLPAIRLMRRSAK
jgi:glycosyltransferase involved in cell wall biosynthesis